MTNDDRAALGAPSGHAGPAIHGELPSMGMAPSEGDSSRSRALATTGNAGRGDEEEGLSEYSRRSIYADAERASKFGQSIEDACPHPWFTDSGKLWRQVWRLAEAAKGQG